jgi:hypothetical protein
MEPRNEQSKKLPEAPKEGSKPRRFRIVKLEERIAPQAAAYASGNTSLRPFGCQKSY